MAHDTTHMTSLPTMTLTVEQLVSLRQMLPTVPKELRDMTRDHSQCVMPLYDIATSPVHNLQARWYVRPEGIELTLMIHGGQHVWTVLLPFAD